MKNELDSFKLLVPRRPRRERAQIFYHGSWHQRRVQFPCFITAKKEVAIVTLQVAALTDLENDI